MLDLLSIRTGEAGMGEAARLLEQPGARPEAVLAAWLRPATTQRPVRWELGLAAEERHLGDNLLAGFPWQTIVRGQPQRRDRDEALAAALKAMLAHCRKAPPGSCRPGAPLATWLAHHGSVLAARALARGHGAAAGPLFNAAASWAPNEPKILNNLAVYLLGRGQPEPAWQACRRALRAQPDYLRAHRTAARAALLARRDDAAVEHARAWLRGLSSPAAARAWLRGLAQVARKPATAAKLRALLPPAVGAGGADAAGQR
jgi:hypothetical protein